MSAAVLLDRLDDVRRIGDGNRWTARCPAHDDSRPSLSARELDDGRVLVHCFAGCDVGEIMASIGLEISDLFPPRCVEDKRPPRERRPFYASDALRLIEYETYFVVMAARTLAEDHALEANEHERLLVAVGRITNARQACGLEPA